MTIPACRTRRARCLDGSACWATPPRQTQELAYGEQRLIEMALALALRPQVLLLDEPMAGVPKGDGARLLAALDALPSDLAVLIIEHDMDLVFRFANRIVVLAEGAVLAEGTPEQIRRDPKVRAAYLGHEHERTDPESRGPGRRLWPDHRAGWS